MIRFLRLFSQFRHLEQSLADSREQWADQLRELTRTHIATEDELESVNATLQMEQVKRISAEAIASERQSEIERMLQSQRELRADLKEITGERIKSVDSINLRLMEAKIPEQPIDFTQHHPAVEKLDYTSTVTKIRKQHRDVDMAVLRAAAKGFPDRIRMNIHAPENIGKVPTLAEIEKTDISAPMVND